MLYGFGVRVVSIPSMLTRFVCICLLVFGCLVSLFGSAVFVLCLFACHLCLCLPYCIVHDLFNVPVCVVVPITTTVCVLMFNFL